MTGTPRTGSRQTRTGSKLYLLDEKRRRGGNQAPASKEATIASANCGRRGVYEHLHLINAREKNVATDTGGTASAARQRQ